MEPVNQPSLVAQLNMMERRLFDLERRRNKDVSELRDLDDVRIDYDGGPDQPDDLDVLTWDATDERWVASPAGGGGGYASYKVHGSWTNGGGFSTGVTDWDVASGVVPITPFSGGGSVFAGLGVGLTGDAGVYQAILTWDGSGIAGAYLNGPRWQKTSGGSECLTQVASYAGAGATAGTITSLFALDPVNNTGDNPLVFPEFVGASCDWAMSLEWSAPLNSYTGSCGG